MRARACPTLRSPITYHSMGSNVDEAVLLMRGDTKACQRANVSEGDTSPCFVDMSE